MTIKQISVFLENREGELAEFTQVLGEKNIDMRALSLADTKEFGILRIIVQNPEKVAEELQKAGYIFSINHVLAVEIPDHPGSFAKVMKILADQHISVEYTYAFITRKESCAYMIFRVADNEKAAKALLDNGVTLATQEELDNL